jgi:hypothetical protein
VGKILVYTYDGVLCSGTYKPCTKYGTIIIDAEISWARYLHPPVRAQSAPRPVIRQTTVLYISRGVVELMNKFFRPTLAERTRIYGKTCMYLGFEVHD